MMREPTDYEALAEQIIHATGGDPKRKAEAAEVIRAALAVAPAESEEWRDIAMAATTSK